MGLHAGDPVCFYSWPFTNPLLAWRYKVGSLWPLRKVVLLSLSLLFFNQTKYVFEQLSNAPQFCLLCSNYVETALCCINTNYYMHIVLGPSLLHFSALLKSHDHQLWPIICSYYFKYAHKFTNFYFVSCYFKVYSLSGIHATDCSIKMFHKVIVF